MLGQHEDFFVELAQVFKKHKVCSHANFPVDFTDETGNHVAGRYKIKEVWINKEGEAIMVVSNEEGTKIHWEIHSDGSKYHHGGYRTSART